MNNHLRNPAGEESFQYFFNSNFRYCNCDNISVEKSFVKIKSEIIPFHAISRLYFSGEILICRDSTDMFNVNFGKYSNEEIKRNAIDYEMVYCGIYYTKDFIKESDGIMVLENPEPCYLFPHYLKSKERCFDLSKQFKQILTGFVLETREQKFFIGYTLVKNKFLDEKEIIQKKVFRIFNVKKEQFKIDDEYKSFFLKRMKDTFKLKKKVFDLYNDIKSHN